MKKMVVIKIGGAALKDTSFLPMVATGVKNLLAQNKHVVLVHGGGPEINKALESAGLTWEFINGQRVTTNEMMAIIDQALTKVNQTISHELQLAGVNVLPLKGNHHSLLQCEVLAPELKQVGKVTKVNASYIKSEMLTQNAVPVICPLGLFANNTSCNINADYAASEIAAQLQADELIFLTDTPGVLNSQKILFEHLTIKEMNDLIEVGIIYGGMLAKIKSVQNALLHHVKTVVITHANNAEKIGNDLEGTFCIESDDQINFTNQEVTLGK